MTSAGQLDSPAARLARAAMVSAISAAGVFGLGWEKVFEMVPRHRLMPRIFLHEGAEYWRAVSEETCADEWLSAVYADDSVATQLDGDPSRWQKAHNGGPLSGVPTCTSSQPSLMARMFAAAELAPGMRVLEIGTGTGYGAALLCDMLGPAGVVTIETDPHLASEARDRLAAMGLRPRVVTGDGRDGHSPGAPYDAILATCAFNHVPPAWASQLTPAGKIVVNIGGQLGGAMLIAVRTGDAALTGRFMNDWATFLAERGAPGTDDIVPMCTKDGEYDTRSTSLDPKVLDDQIFGFTAFLATGDARPYWGTGDGNEPITGLLSPGGSWCEVYPPHGGLRKTEEGGPRALWRQAEQAYEYWDSVGRPAWHRYGVTITGDVQRVWLDDPATPTPWCLPTHNDARPAI